MQYMNLLVDEYGLRKLPKKKPVIGRDDLYLLLYTHWVLDNATYPDERQRVTVATGILAAVFFGCRPCSLFDTRIKFDDSNESGEPLQNMAIGTATKSRQDSDEAEGDSSHHRERRGDDKTRMAADSGCDIGSNTTTESYENSDSNSDSDSNYGQNCDSNCDSDQESDQESDSISTCTEDDELDADNDLDTDDECNAGQEETRTFLYRHITISIVANEFPGKPNLVFMKATLLHTKGEDNHPRM